MNVTRVTPLRTVNTNVLLNASGTGDTEIVAAAAGARFRVLSVVAVATIANNIHFRSAANPISATFALGANGGIVLPSNEHGWFETNVGEALNVNMSVATATGIQIQYIKIVG